MSSDSIARMKPSVHASLCAFVAAIALLVFVRMNLAASLIANFKMSSCWNEVGSWLDSSLWRFLREEGHVVCSFVREAPIGNDPSWDCLVLFTSFVL